MATFILSYPDRAFVPRGGEPKAGSASAAFTQWLALCDEIHRAQGRILVLDPTMAGEVSSVYSGLLGAPFLAPGKLPQPLFLRAHFGEVAQEDAVHKAIAEAGLVVQAAQHRWQGQVDVIPVGRNRFILTHGGSEQGSSVQAEEEVKALLPLGAQTLSVELSATCPRGSAAMCCITDPSNKPLLLISRKALKSHTPEQIGPFVGTQVEMAILSEEDVAVFATECLNVRGTLILPVGCSTILRGLLLRRGFRFAEVDVSHLVGENGGGPHVLACELPGLVLSDEAPSYLLRRERLHILCSEYET
jgi:hypothetical protein